jgi:hypothetical protein
MMFDSDSAIFIEGLLDGDRGAQAVWQEIKRAVAAGRSLTVGEHLRYAGTVQRLSQASDGDIVVDLENMTITGGSGL